MTYHHILEQISSLRKAVRPLTSRRYHQVALASVVFLAITATTGVVSEQDTTPADGRGSASLTAADTAPAPADGSVPQSAEASSPSAPPVESPPVAAPPRPSSKLLDYEYQTQPNYYWCGPAATRIALTARGKNPSQGYIAGKLRTTVNGTDSAKDTTRALNQLGDTDFYRTREIRGRSATPAEMDRLQADVVRAVSDGFPVVANIVGGASDTAGRWHAYDGGHYVTIVGYRDHGRTVKVADPANASVSSYWVTTITMANWIAQRGYSA